jgi:hypothetical protein
MPACERYNGDVLGDAKRRRTKKCTRVADRAFSNGEIIGRNRVISIVLKSKTKTADEQNSRT